MENTNKPKQKLIKRIVIAIVVVLVLVILFMAGFVIGKVTTGKISLKVNPDLYKQTVLPDLFDNTLTEQVWTMMKADYFDKDKLDEKKMFYNAMSGFVAGAGDPHTTFFDPDTSKDFDSQIDGRFGGIGAEINIKDSILTVVAPLPGTPAEKAGLKTGDKIYSIDSKDTIGMALDTAMHLIRGEAGTKVTLLVVTGDEMSRDVVIERAIIEIKSVKWEFRKDGIALLTISTFGSDTTALMDQFVVEVKKNNPNGIIVDLRNDPGGLLDTSIDVCGYWLSNKLALVERFADGHEAKYETKRGATLSNYKTVILSNGGRASASEIMAGAFQDYKTATIIGEKSYGKGSVQELRQLPDGSSLKLTVAKWFTPNGRTIDKTGISPDIEVKVTKEDFEKKIDVQMNKAVEMINNK